MKKILKEYADILREEERLEERKRDLYKRLSHVITPNGKELGDRLIADDHISNVRRWMISCIPEDSFNCLEVFKICDRVYGVLVEEGKVQVRYYADSSYEATKNFAHNEGW